jgi:hypothetical protein
LSADHWLSIYPNIPRNDGRHCNDRVIAVASHPGPAWTSGIAMVPPFKMSFLTTKLEIPFQYFDQLRLIVNQ